MNDTSTRENPRVSTPSAPVLRLDMGVIIAGAFDAYTLRLVRASQQRLAEQLTRWFGDFDWRFHVLRRRDIDSNRIQESTQLLQIAAEEREAHRWDAVVMLTEQELVPHYRSFALAALSRPLDAALISTSRLATDIEAALDGTAETMEERLIDRLATLQLHAMAHLGGLGEARERHRLLYRPDSLDDLDAMETLDTEERRELEAAFTDMADIRLEEMSLEDSGLRSRWRFLLRAVRINREEIGEAVLAARPWEFPMRLSRLSTAAVSTVAILLMTAEGWDLALRQSPSGLLLLGLCALTFTTAFVINRQQLLLGRYRDLREQLVVSRVSALLIIVLGLVTTWCCMLVLAFLASSLLFDDLLIADWANTSALEPDTMGFAIQLKMSMFCASLGLLIGSLGASFEDQHHFRHVIYVDEEL